MSEVPYGAPTDDAWIDDASLPTLKRRYMLERVFGKEPEQGYENWIRSLSLSSAEWEYYKLRLLGALTDKILFSGVVEFEVDLPINGVQSGEVWLVEDTNEALLWLNDQWINLGAIAGKGEKGDKGDKGDKGEGYKSYLQILALAQEDGWSAVYDPNNPETVTVNGDGRIEEIQDGLGNNPPMTRTGFTPELVTRGTVTMMKGGILTASDSEGSFGLTEEYGFLQVAESSNAHHTGNEFLINGSDAATRASLVQYSTNRQFGFGNGNVNKGVGSRAAGLHIFEYKRKGNSSALTIDGALESRGSFADGLPATWRVGGFGTSESNRWQHRIGISLLHPNPSDEVLARMRALIAEVYGISFVPPIYWPETRAITVDSKDNIVLCNGDPDWVSPSSIMSMTKMVNALTAREFITDAMLDDTIEIVYDDYFRSWEAEPIFKEGDIVSWRNLFYAMALPSSDLAPRAIARVIGSTYLTPQTGAESAGPVKAYLGKMTRNAQDWGYEYGHFSAVGGGSKLSLKNVTDVLRRVEDDPVLSEIFGTRTHSFSVTGPNARTISIRHTIDSGSSPDPFNEFVLGKTGTGGGRQFVSCVWEAPNGERFRTVIMSVKSGMTPSHNRYDELFKTIERVKSQIVHIDKSHSIESGESVMSTAMLTITDLVAFGDPSVEVQSGSFAGIRVNLTGNTCTLSIYDVKFNTANFNKPGVLPEGFYPLWPEYGVMADTDGNAVRVLIGSLGGITLGNTAGATIRGSITFQTPIRGVFPRPPYPGYPSTRI